MIRFFKYISYTICLVLIIPIINFSIDYHSSEKFNNQFVNDLIVNDSLAIKENISEIETIKKRIESYNTRSINKKTFILGSSRSMQFGKPIDRDVENLSVSGSHLVDMKNIYRMLKQTNIKIDTLYIEISQWIFNPPAAVRKNWNNSTRDFLRNLKKMFSWKYFIENINPIKYSKNIDSGDFIRYSDGTIKYSTVYRQDKKIDNIKNYAKGEVYNLQGFNNIEKIDISDLNNFIDEIKKDSIFIYLLKQPYHPLINNQILNKYPLIKKMDTLVDKTASLFKIEIVGSFYPDEASLTESDYYDGMHLTPSGFKKLLKIKPE